MGHRILGKDGKVYSGETPKKERKVKIGELGRGTWAILIAVALFTAHLDKTFEFFGKWFGSSKFEVVSTNTELMYLDEDDSSLKGIKLNTVFLNNTDETVVITDYRLTAKYFCKQEVVPVAGIWGEIKPERELKTMLLPTTYKDILPVLVSVPPGETSMLTVNFYPTSIGKWHINSEFLSNLGVQKTCPFEFDFASEDEIARHPNDTGSLFVAR